MKKGFILLLAAISLSVSAQSKLDLGSRASLRKHQYNIETIQQTGGAKTLARKATATPMAVTGMILLQDGATPEELEAEGITVIKTRGNIAMVSMPFNDVERLSTLKCIKKMQLARPVAPKMDLVRKEMGVDKIHAGSDGLPQAYTGKGVVTGIVDAGFDPNHVNFRDENDSSRIKSFTGFVTDQTSSLGYSGYNIPTDKLGEFTTDNTTTFHGSHTLGIMAGGYKGNATVAVRKSAFATEVIDTINPFYGVAYESDIAVSGGDMYDMLIALGVEGVLDYAYRTEKPCVINLSLGSNTGTHDGNSIMGQYLELAGEEAIICMSAGNEGDLPIALNQTFTAEDTVLRTFIYPQQSTAIYPNLRYGQVYIYSDDATEFTFKAVIYNKSRGTITFSLPVTASTGGVPVYYASPGWAQDGDLTHQNFSNAFDGYIGAGSMYDEATGRYYVLVDYYTTDNQSKNANGNYILGFVVEGKKGQRIDCFCDGTFTYLSDYGIEDWDMGSCNGSISDMACARNVIVVGAYNTRSSWASLDGGVYGYQGFIDGDISSFSSYGTLIDGRNLPHICAPGTTTISSSNTYFVEDPQNYMDNAALQAKYVEENRTNYWHQQMGTSMSTPAVAGAIALWLEADPSLTFNDALDIIQTTAIKDSYVLKGDSVQWGAGKFDALGGLKEVIRRAASVDNISIDENRMIITANGYRNYNIFIGGEESINAVVYNISGQPVLNQSAEGDELNLNVANLQSGIYILNVNGTHSQRILVK